jgi:exo-beta-1,3-glucanase (GH17 family)
MSAQDVTFGIALLGFLGTLSVQTINYLSTINVKELDAQQRQKDRDQELRKIYVAKKIEAGEAFVARLVATIDKLDMARIVISATDSDGEIASQQLQTLNEQVEQAANIIILKSGHPYLYFEATMLEQQSGSVMPKLMQIERKLHELQSTKSEIQSLFDETPPSQQKDNIKNSYSENRREFKSALASYAECALEHRAYLVNACETMRQSLAKYDLSE